MPSIASLSAAFYAAKRAVHIHLHVLGFPKQIINNNNKLQL